MIVILDNGHGENTPGKRSPIWEDGSQLFEYEFTRDIVQRISSKLTSLGIQNYILVPELKDISLTTRVKRANKIYNKDNDSILISIHANAGKGTGWEAHIALKASKNSEILADCFYKVAQTEYPNWKLRSPLNNNTPWKSNFTIINATDCPAILTENFFMDTEKDCKYIMSEKGRNDIANMHISAILKYLNVKDNTF